MSFAQGLRWSGKGVSNGRFRLSNAKPTQRFFSLKTPRLRTSSFSKHTPFRSSPSTFVYQQHRSLSLFGWGTAKPAADDFNSKHTSPQSANVSQSVSQGPEVASPAVDAPTTIKASHATSDTPDPSILQAQSVSKIEPQALKSLEDYVALPHGGPTADGTPEVDLSTVPESIGYLKDVCGLDYGWGPSALIEWSIEHLHIYSGLSWSISIVAVAFLTRLAIFKLSVNASDQAVKMRAIQPIIQPLRERYKQATAANDRTTATAVGSEIRAITKEAGVSTMTMLSPILIQIPLSFGGFRFLRGACTLPVPAFEHESWLWHTDLTLADPVILPVVSAGITYLTMSSNVKSGATTMSAEVVQLMVYAFPAVSLIFLHFQPGAVQLWFLVNGICSFIQSTLIRNATFRVWFNMAPLLPPAPKLPASGAAPPTGGLNMRRTPPPAPVQDEPVSDSNNRSSVDNFVDNVKKNWDTASSSGKKMWKTATGQQEDKIAERKKKQLEEQMTKYEISRRQDLEIMREARNRSAAAAAADRESRGSTEVAGMRMKTPKRKD